MGSSGSVSTSLNCTTGSFALALGRSCAFAARAAALHGALGGVRGRAKMAGAGAKRTLSLGGGERLRLAACLDGERLRRVEGLGGDTVAGGGLADRVRGEAFDLEGRGPADRDLLLGADLGDEHDLLGVAADLGEEERDLMGAAAALGRAVNVAPALELADQSAGLPFGK